MTEEVPGRRQRVVKRVLTELFLPTITFGIWVGFATGDWPAALVTGLAISSGILVPYLLDQRFVHPRLEAVSPDWLRLGLEITLLLLEHVLGAVAALLVCRRLFGFQIVPRATWLGVAAAEVDLSRAQARALRKILGW